MMNFALRFENDIVNKIYSFTKDELLYRNIPQPIFVVGSHGAGKSSIMKLLEETVIRNGLSHGLKVLNGKHFFNSQDIIHAIEGIHYDGSRDIENDAQFERKIVLIDDIDFYFKRSTYENQYLLRNYLNQESAPLLIASVSNIDDYLGDYKAPFFEGVRLVYIPPFETSIVDNMDIPKEKKARIISLMKLQPPVVRSLKNSSDIVAQSSNSQEDYIELINRAAPLYRWRLQNLPINSQRILHTLANMEKPSTLSELRVYTGLASGVLSTYLRQLVKSGDIRKIHPGRRGEPYEIKDKLFKLWLSNRFPE